jgi:hypothetical protein
LSLRALTLGIIKVMKDPKSRVGVIFGQSPKITPTFNP